MDKERNLPDTISYYLLLCLVISLPFDRFYSHLLLAGFIIHTLTGLKKQRLKQVFTPGILLLQAVFWTTLMGISYAPHSAPAFNELGKQAAIFLFPVILCLNPLNLASCRDGLLRIFAVVCTLTVAYLFADALVTIKHYRLPLNELFSHAFTHHSFSEPIGMHATFFSMQLVVALSVVLHKLQARAPWWHKTGYGLSGLLLLLGMVQLGSKSILVILIICMIATILIGPFSRKRKMHYLVAAGLAAAVIFPIVIRQETFRSRFIDGFSQDLAIHTSPRSSDTRLARWKVAGRMIAHKPLAGYGTGSEIPLLHEAFFRDRLYSSFLHHLNVHNQYLSLLFKYGIWGLAIYLFTLSYGFYRAVKVRDIVFFSFMTVVAIVSLSENILDVDKGIFFYGFFFSFLTYSANQSSGHHVILNKYRPVTETVL